MYRWSTQHLVRYSTSQRAVTFETRNRQTFQYGFSTRSGLYTSGDSVTYGFQLLESDGTRVRQILGATGARGLFPVARTDKDTFLSLIEYDSSGRISASQLARVRDGKLDVVTRLPASPLGGTIIGNRLYFTTAATRMRGTYDLWAMDLDSSEPSQVRSGLKRPRIFSAAGRLMIDGRVDGQDSAFPCDNDCAVEDTGQWLFSLRPNQDGDLVLEVFSLRSGKAVWSTVGDIVDYRIDNADLTVYLNGNIIAHRLEHAS